MVKLKEVLYNGAGLLEALLAIALLSSLAPFVLKSVNKQTATTQNIALAKEIENIIYAVSNYMDAHMPVHSESALSHPVEPVPHITTGETQISSLLADFGLSGNLIAIYNLFNEAYLVMDKQDDSISGYFILSGGNMEPLQLQEVASMIGPNAGVIDEGNVYGMAHNWGLNTDGILQVKISSGIIVQISRGAGRVDIYLNRVIPEKAIMYTDIFMGATGNNKICKTDGEIEVLDNKNRLIDFKIVNTGVVDAQSVIQSFRNMGPYQELDGKIQGKDIPQFKVSEITEVGNLKIANFVIPNPARFVEPDNGYTLTIKANKQVTSLADVTTVLSDPTKDSYIGLKLNSIDAQNSSLKPYTDKSPLRNIDIISLYANKVQAGIFTSSAQYFNANAVIRAKEIRTPEVTWGSTINVGTIVTGKILYGDKELVDSNGIMHIPDFEIFSYNSDGNLDNSSKQLSKILDRSYEIIRDTCTEWNNIYIKAYPSGKSECFAPLGL